MKKQSVNRDLFDYQKKYRILPFEFHQAFLRRQEVLKIIKDIKPRFWTEVGCGMNPLFLDYESSNLATVIEPAELFYTNLERLKRLNPHIKTQLLNYKIEDINTLNHFSKSQDLIVISSLLHEVQNSNRILESAIKLGDNKTKYIFTVPNAYSLHRQLAERLGIIDNIYQLSKQQKSLQQKKVYCMESLNKELLDNGFVVEEIKTIILKPFTHAQMQKLLDQNILTKEQIYALSQLSDIVPNLGSEILVLASLNH